MTTLKLVRLNISKYNPNIVKTPMRFNADYEDVYDFYNTNKSYILNNAIYKTFNIEDLNTAQATANLNLLQKMAKSIDDVYRTDTPIIVIKYNEQYWLIDGNYRTILLYGSGEDKLRALYFDADNISRGDNMKIQEESANELEKRTKKHKKKQKGLPMNGLNPNAGNVEINNKVFNAMNNVTNSPSTNPTGPMGEEMSKLEALSVLSRLNEDESVNERDFAIYCDNSFGKYKVANWKATDAETAVAEFKELNPRYTKTGLITAVEI